jgi:radical SAM superfamily enzyme YgiQ (UPF0313 family)
MKIILINPGFRYTGKDLFPLGLAYIAAVCKKAGLFVQVVDQNINQQIPWEALPEFDLIALSLTTPAFQKAKRLITELQAKKNPNALLIAGGHHPTFCPDETLQAGFDIAIRGEAEITIQNLIEKLIHKLDWADIDGISFIDTTQTIKSNKNQEPIKNLDKIGFPVLDLFHYQSYNPISIITSRGCPYHCVYCAAAEFWGHKTRFRSIENVIQEMDQISTFHPFKELKFQDSVFTLNKKRTLALLQKIAEKKYPFHWSCETRADCIDEEIVDACVQSKCKSIMLGLESGSQAILDRSNRKIHVTQIKAAAQLIMKRGIGLRISVIFGLPWETTETVRETLQLLQEIKPNVTFLNLATLYPGCTFQNASLHSQNETWIRQFGGHGMGGQLILPNAMKPADYRKNAEICRKAIELLNKVHWSRSS